MWEQNYPNSLQLLKSDNSLVSKKTHPKAQQTAFYSIGTVVAVTVNDLDTGTYRSSAHFVELSTKPAT
jgi:hypothetical protein